MPRERLRDSFKPIVNRVPLEPRARENRRHFHLRAAAAGFGGIALLVAGETLDIERATDVGVGLLLVTPFYWLIFSGRDWRDDQRR